MSCRDATTGVHSEDVTDTSWILNSSDKPKIPDPTSEQSASAAPPPPSLPLPSPPPPPDVSRAAAVPWRSSLLTPRHQTVFVPRSRPSYHRSPYQPGAGGKGESKKRASSCTQTNPVTELLIAGNYGEDARSRFWLRVALDFRTSNPVSNTQIPRQQLCSPSRSLEGVGGLKTNEAYHSKAAPC